MIFNEPFGGIVPGAQGAALVTLLRTDTPMTGRQIHGLLSDRHSLWTIQEALKALAQIGLIDTRTIGRAGVHTVNEDHFAIGPLRTLVDPIHALTDVVREAGGEGVETVILFGSLARGDSTPQSDVDLAVIAPSSWDRRTEVQDAVRARLGNHCDVLVFTPAEFAHLRRAGEPVIADILADGIALIGSIPRTTGAA